MPIPLKTNRTFDNFITVIVFSSAVFFTLSFVYMAIIMASDSAKVSPQDLQNTPDWPAPAGRSQTRRANPCAFASFYYVVSKSVGMPLAIQMKFKANQIVSCRRAGRY